MRRQLLTLILSCFVISPLFSQTSHTLKPAEAKDHVGEAATVCGKVASTSTLLCALVLCPGWRMGGTASLV